MNPQIRYGDQPMTSNGVKFIYDHSKPHQRPNSTTKPIDPNNKHPTNQKTMHEVLSSQPILNKHKSSSPFDTANFYQQTNFTQSYRIEPSSYANNETKYDAASYKSYKPANQNQNQNSDANSVYKSTNYHNYRDETKFQSANDFFTGAEESIKKQEQLKSQLRHTETLQRQQSYTQSQPNFYQLSSKSHEFTVKTNQLPTKSQQKPEPIIYQPKYEPTSDECQKCQQMKKQNERIVVFMREQLQIGAKQFTDRMNKIIVDQAKQIMDLRKSLVNNQKTLINFRKLQASQNQQNNWKNQRSISPAGIAVVKQRSPSKLSLTKSNTSISTTHPSKQKITMVSKELSPSKSTLKKQEKQQQIASHQKLSSTTILNPNQALTPEEIQRKIKSLEEHIQVLFKMEHERNQKTLVMNKKVQILEKGILNFFGSRTQQLKTFLSQWVNTYDSRIQQLYQEMKVISSRVGTMSNNSQNPPLKPINSTNLKNTQNSYQSSQIISGSTNLKDQEFNINKIVMKLKHFSSQIEDLKEISTNLRTKEYKYDNFQIQSLKKIINDLHLETRKLEKTREDIKEKLIENDEKLEKVIEMSKYSQMGSHKEIYENQMKKDKKSNIMRNNSVEITYSNKNYMNETNYKTNDGTKSIKSEFPGKYDPMSQDQTILPKFMNMMGPKKHSAFEGYSHSQFNGFAGEQSGFSQYAEESVYNVNEENERGRKYQNEGQHEDEESFERSQNEDGSEEEEQEEEDDFFYRVDLSKHDKTSHSSSNSQLQYNHKTRNEPSRNRASHQQQHNFIPSSTINRFMEVIEYRQSRPLKIEIDETGYIKSADNGMYIVDRNMDGFDLSRQELEWLKNNGIVIMEK